MPTYNSNMDLISAIREDNRKALAYLYNKQREHFLKWAGKRFDCDQDTLLDAFQDALVALYFNVKEGRIQKLESSPEAYLFGIAKNILLKKVTRERRVVLSDNFKDEWFGDLDLNLYQRIEQDHRKIMMKEAFLRLKDSCRKILQLFYFDRYSIEAIQISLGYGSEGTVKTRKVQCMQSLKKIIETLQE